MRTLVFLSTLGAPSLAFAHGGPQESAWTFEPWLVFPLGLSLLVWSLGSARRWRRSHGGKAELRRKALFFALGWMTLTLAVLSPLHAAGERSFTMHMVEHEIIMMLAAPLLVLSRPLPNLLWACAQPWRSLIGALIAASAPFWRAMAAPLFATTAQAAALWLWHTPALFDLALGNDAWHAAQHFSFLITALLFWSAMIDARREIGLRAFCLFATSIIGGALGALMAISQSPWYAPYALLAITPQGLTPAEDQQLAGVLMWVPGGFVHAGAAIALLAPFLRAGEPGKRAS